MRVSDESAATLAGVLSVGLSSMAHGDQTGDQTLHLWQISPDIPDTHLNSQFARLCEFVSPLDPTCPDDAYRFKSDTVGQQ